MFLIKIVITVLLAANLGHNFPVDRLKLPPTYDDERCPPGIGPCVPDIRENLPEPTRGSDLTTAFSNTTNESIARVPTTTPSVPSNHSADNRHEVEANSPSDANVPGKGKSTGYEFQKRYHPCPIGIWVCRKKRAIRRMKRRMRQAVTRPEFSFTTL